MAAACRETPSENAAEHSLSARVGTAPQPRGAIYGAHAFAESLGVRFLAPNATLSPNNGTDPEMGASRQLDKASHARDYYTHQ